MRLERTGFLRNIRRAAFLGALALGGCAAFAARTSCGNKQPPHAVETILPQFCTALYSSYSFALDHSKILLSLENPGEQHTLRQIYDLSMNGYSLPENKEGNGRRPVVLPVANLPTDLWRLVELSGRAEFIRATVDEVVFTASAGSFVGYQEAVLDDKIRPGKKLVFIGLTTCNGNLEDPIEAFVSLIHESQHRKTLIGVFSGIEPRKAVANICIYEKTAQESARDALLSLKKADGLSAKERDQIELHLKEIEGSIKNWEEDLKREK